ncbi:peroxisomal ATPase PEX6-like [Ornithodoros turicata]|uniref:peroxisomal ATPase PEX6-like n=1 Tax=Ornithodoros turicata TaxID=34597 RepID=UPI0031391D37
MHSERFRARFCFSLPHSEDSTIIKISSSDASRIHLESKSGVLALTDIANVAFYRPGYLFCYVVEENGTFSTVDSQEVVNLHVCSGFSTHCDLVEDKEVFVLPKIKCQVLRKISLLVYDAELYDELEKGDALRKLSLRDPPVVCRTGSTLPTFDKGCAVVVGCEPTRQGLLTSDTRILVIHHKAIGPTVPLTASSSSDSLPDYFELVRYTGHIILPGQRRLSSATQQAPSSLLRSLAASLRRSTSFRVHILPKLPSEKSDDVLNTIYLTKSTMALLGLSNGTWTSAGVQEKRCHSDATKKSGRRVIVKSLESIRMNVGETDFAALFGSPSDEVAFVGPQLWFHLNGHPTTFLRPTARLWVRGCTGEDDIPPYATEFHLALVHSPNYNIQLDYSTLLHRHFAIPRYLCKGDIISISAHDPIDSDELLAASFTERTSVTFFKVTQIEGPPTEAGYLCSRENSRLYQAGTTRSYIPATMEACYSSLPVHPIWHSPLPPFLGTTIECLQTMLLPFLCTANHRRRIQPLLLLSGSPGSGKTTVVKALGLCLSVHVYQVNCVDIVGDTAAATEARMKAALHKANYYAPCIVHLKNVNVIGQEKEQGGVGDPRIMCSFAEIVRSLNGDAEDLPVVVIGTTSSPDDLSQDLASLFLHTVTIPYPNEERRLDILDALLSSCPKCSTIDIAYFAQRTAGFALGDLCALVIQASMAAYRRFQTTGDEASTSLAGLQLCQGDLLRALEDIHAARSAGAPQIPEVTWEDVGGLGEVKNTLLDTLQLPLQHPRLLDAGLKRSGILLYGPPGTGKTLLAKAVATECALSFLSVKGPELINMYVGQSEENVRSVFARGRSAAPCVIFFDELDSLAPNRGRSGDSGGVMDRVVSQLLAEMDGLNKSADVFVIGATNRPDLLDPAILRPGRFDRLLYVGIPEDKISQLKILKALTRKFNLSKDLDLEEVVQKCPPNLTGADLYSLCSGAMANATRKHIELLEAGVAEPSSGDIQIDHEDFEVALSLLAPSVSVAELERYKEIRQKMSP